MASVSYAHKTTNNIAEYHGFMNELRYAALHRLSGMNVVGDSNLILTKLQLRKIPKTRHLQGCYEQFRMMADRLMVISWTHHRRAFNKMADHPANIAMDAQTSVQVDATDMPRLPSRWTPVLKIRQGDVEHWLDNNPDMTVYGPPSHLTGVV
ncbi:unnamed protein product [Phytophthora fragariaefolia]|uniref:Unnamed protein product n=1 Tax=Phytophthora fragariaefolia TaxID=1490495 RepID=A0A9W7D6A4_9STRA|nr:unnamed protein product [Phytophthora fragariaefolia]